MIKTNGQDFFDTQHWLNGKDSKQMIRKDKRNMDKTSWTY